MKSCSGKPCNEQGDCEFCGMADGPESTKSDYCLWSRETRCRLAELPLTECDCERCLAFTPNESYGE